MAIEESLVISSDSDLADLDRAIDRIDDLDDTLAEVDNAGALAERGADRAGGGISRLTKYLAIAAVAVAAFAAGLGIGIMNATAQYDESMRNIQAVTGQSNAEIADLARQINDIGSQTFLEGGSQAAASAYYDIAGGMANVEARLPTLRAAIATAEAGNADLGETTKALISVMNSYQLSADKASFASDVLTRTVGMGVGTMGEFASALPTVTGMANAMGISLDDLSGMMAYLTTQGNTASNSATLLSNMMTTLQNPTGALADIIHDLGYESGQAMVDALGLNGAFAAIKDAGGGSFDGIITNTEALRGAIALTGDGVNTFLTDFKGGIDGATEAARKMQLQSFNAQFEILKNRVQAVAISIGLRLMPYLAQGLTFFNEMTNGVGGLITQFNNFRKAGLTPIQSLIRLISGRHGDGQSYFTNFLRTLGLSSQKAREVSLVVGGAITKIVQFANSLGKAAMDAWELATAIGNALMPTFKSLIDDGIAVLQEVIPVIASAVGDLVDIFSSLSPESITLIAVGLTAMAAPTIIAGIISLGVTLAGMAASAYATMLAMAPLAILLGIVIAYETNFGGLRDRVNETKAAFAEGDWAGVIRGIAGAMAAIPLGLATEFGNLVGIDVPGGLSAWSGVFDNLGVILDYAWQSATKLGFIILYLLTTTLGSAKQAAEDLGNIGLLGLVTVMDRASTAATQLALLAGFLLFSGLSKAAEGATAISNGVIGIADGLATFVTSIPERLAGLGETLTNNLQIPFTSAIDLVKALFTPEGAEGLLMMLANFAGAGIEQALKGIDGVLGTNLGSIFTAAVDLIKGYFALEGETSIVAALVNFVTTGIVTGLTGLDQALGTNLTGWFNGAVEVVKGLMGDGDGSIGAILKSMPTQIASWLNEVPAKLREFLVTPFTNALTEIDNYLPNSVTIGFGSVEVPNILDINGLANAAFKGGKVPTASLDLGGFTIDMPDSPLSGLMPRDSGGTGVPGQGYIIRKQATPEAFFPSVPGNFVPNIDRLGGGDITVNIHVHESSDPRETARQVIRELQKSAPGTFKFNMGGI